MNREHFDPAKVEQALRKVWRNAHCPFSGDNNWTLVQDYVEVRPYQEGSLVLGGPIYPAVMVVCNTCGYMATFNAIRLGLLSEKEATEAVRHE
jgi:hypothetical protein